MPYPEKDLDTNVKRFHEKILDCCDQIAEDVRLDICMIWSMSLSFLNIKFFYHEAKFTLVEPRRTC